MMVPAPGPGRRTVLLIAYHFPPVKGSSGVQRTLRFAQHLPKFGWHPIVLTIDPGAYENVSSSAGNEIPVELEVHRAFGVDTAARLSLFGRYPRLLAVPDRWATWRFWAVPAALRILRRTAVDAIWSTFPIATAHKIGLEIARRSGLPWIAEFRDPMWQGEEYPPDPLINRAWRRLESEIFQRADAVVVATPSARSLYLERFPSFGAARIGLIENGYDEETFERAAAALHSDGCHRIGRPGTVTLLHSGLIYPSERDPTHLFEALASLKRAGHLSAAQFQLVLRASGNELAFRSRLEKMQIAELVRLEPAIDYLPALQEMLTADGLVILQAANCNAQIPAKLYEYLRAERPILALTHPDGDTARTLAALGVGTTAPLDSVPKIEAALLDFLSQIRNGTWRRLPRSVIAGFSREAQAGLLAERLNHCIGQA